MRSNLHCPILPSIRSSGYDMPVTCNCVCNCGDLLLTAVLGNGVTPSHLFTRHLHFSAHAADASLAEGCVHKAHSEILVQGSSQPIGLQC